LHAEEPDKKTEEARQRIMTIRLLLVAFALAGLVFGLLAKRFL
jgi:hypothetical protein